MSFAIPSVLGRWICLLAFSSALILPPVADAAVTELNSSGGTNSTNGLHIYIEDTSKMQIRRLNNTGQVYSPTAVPPSTSLDNGIFLFANGSLYGPSHNVSTWAANAMYSTSSISAASPATASAGVPQSATLNLGVNNGPQISVVWSYTLPYDFITANVTLTIPNSFAVSASNPVRYYQAIDTYLGGSDYGCGVTFIDTNGHRVVGTYPPASGTSCPSSTSIPSGVSIVESFRERSGAFSHYCTAYWADFWDKTSPLAPCSLWTGQILPNTVTTTYQDTGVGIEYDFTAPGTYTFSYDFVIGSPAVPPYDHVEIQHDGSSGNQCSTMTVLGCTSGTVPCPAGQALNANFSFSMSPASPTATWTPTPVVIASGDLQKDVQVQFAAGGTYTLSATGFSQTPLNGVKCWNRSGGAQSCNFTAANVACYAKGLDACSNSSGSPTPRCAASGNRLYTKATGQAVKFDLIALNAQTGGVLDSAFNGAVSVDLVDNPTYNTSDNTCDSTSTKAGLSGSAQSIQFSGGYPQTPVQYSYAAGSNTSAAQNVRVRFTQGTRVLCSADKFAIRPSGFTVTGIDTTTGTILNNTGLTGIPKLTAGADFTLQADGGTGYSGTPAALDNSLAGGSIWTHVGQSDPTDRLILKPPATGFIAFAANGTTPNAVVQYHEYGRFVIGAGAVIDKNFTSPSGDIAGGDCIGDATAGSSTADRYSNTPNSAGKIGCYVANQSNSAIGRFAPDHFAVTGSAITSACVPASGSSFTYMGQPFANAIVQARAESKTANLLLTKYDAAQVATADPTATLATPTFVAQSGATDLTNRITGWTTPFSWSAGLSGYSGAGLSLGRAGAPTKPLDGAPDGPYNVSFLATVKGDPDLCPGTSFCLNSVQAGPTVVERYGRLKLVNAYGTQNAPMRLPVRAEYWTTAGWVLNRDDTTTGGSKCTSLADGYVALGSTANAQESTGITLAGNAKAGNLRNGMGSIFLPRPSAAGWRNVALNLAGTTAAPDQNCVTLSATGGVASLTYLRFASGTDRRWTCPVGSPGGSDPWARATFGTARRAGQAIYQRENF